MIDDLDNLPYIPGLLLVKLPELSDEDASRFVDFFHQLAYEIDSHYFSQAWKYHSHTPTPDDFVFSAAPSEPSDPPF